MKSELTFTNGEPTFTFIDMSTPRSSGANGNALPAKQQRSHETLDRLLAATEKVLSRDGLQATTVAAVAEEAGMSVGIVYKRFPDKDALMRAVYVRFFERSDEANAAALDPSRWTTHSAAQIIDALVGGMVRAYVMHEALLRSLIQFAESHADAAFRAQAEAMRRKTFDAIGTLLLQRPQEITHRDRRNAIEFSLLLLGLALRGIVLGDGMKQYKFTESQTVLARELSHAVKAYLGAK